ncbi:peptidylprolyl isomerase [Ulvibacter litoralis]|uniref:Peptidylprolyl isomerase n=1 Tax=Ulvibacter litoralis TaxID=227084 RepID=A0A1G7GZ37_9FLAO|nr:peptidylprolyl isomerase [Ulvibacter litoralis]GHC59592.1 hypothetical protein GCM10008083_25610 [Ulvibacter litoralis]SDE93334.1 hypothetical protein SAMN05421855_103409 [Ulvibacter litoralis]
MHRVLFIFFSSVLFVSCNYFEQGTDKVPVARVNDSYLYKEDLLDLVSEGTSKEDSTLIIGNYINRWATQQLLISQAKINLPQEKQNGYEKLVLQYKDDLFTEAYKSIIVAKQLDSVILDTTLKSFYEANKENFKLNDALVKIRYLFLDKNFTNLNQIKEKFLRFNTKDKKELSDLALQFKSANLNDSVWVEKETLFKVLPIVQSNSNQVLKKSNFTQLQDSIGVYLVKIEDLLNPKDIAPLSYIKPTIEQIILNKRKLELTKKLEKDITKDAIKNNDFEIYNPQ